MFRIGRVYRLGGIGSRSDPSASSPNTYETGTEEIGTSPPSKTCRNSGICDYPHLSAIVSALPSFGQRSYIRKTARRDKLRKEMPLVSKSALGGMTGDLSMAR